MQRGLKLSFLICRENNVFLLAHGFNLLYLQKGELQLFHAGGVVAFLQNGQKILDLIVPSVTIGLQGKVLLFAVSVYGKGGNIVTCTVDGQIAALALNLDEVVAFTLLGTGTHAHETGYCSMAMPEVSMPPTWLE